MLILSKDTSEALEFYRRGLIKAPYKVVGLSELQKVYVLAFTPSFLKSC